MKRSSLSNVIIALFLASVVIVGCKKRKSDHQGHDHKDHKHDHKGHDHKDHKKGDKHDHKKGDKHDHHAHKGHKHKGHDHHEKTRSWLVPAYEKVRKALAADKLRLSKTSAKALATKVTRAKAHDKKAFEAISLAAKKLSQAKNIRSARLSFGVLSKALISHLHAHKEVKGLQAYQCPMAKGYKKWIQADTKMANPYMGKKMLKCGSKIALKP